MMRVLILGASGRTGRHLLSAAKAAGHEVTCLVRKPERISVEAGIKVLAGSPASRELLAAALQDCEAVVSALNISRTSDFPWAALRTPPDFLSQVMQQLLELCTTQVKQLVICSAWGVAETRQDLPFWFRWLIEHSHIGIAYADHARQEQLLQAAAFNYTLVRPVGLTNGQKLQQVRETLHHEPRPSLTINRKTLAQFMIDCLQRDDLSRRAVVISRD